MKLLILTAILAATAWGYCAYYSKVGEYTPTGYTTYKVCQYGNGGDIVSMRWDRYGICPYSIQYDHTSGYVCGY